MKAIELKCDYRSNPLGIGNKRLRFTWQCEGGRRQSAYQVKVWEADAKENCLFDSGKVASDRMVCDYEGAELQSGMRLCWNVTLWDDNGQQSESQTAFFEMGLLDKENWVASWICGQDTDQKKRLPADYYKKEFTIKAPVKQARLYATACGVYTARINGQRLKGVLAPGCTEYEKRLYYQTYDVTSYLQEKNELLFAVGDGWFKGKIGSGNTEYFFGTQTKLLAQLVLTYENGEKEVIGTDESFMWSNDGAVRYSDLKDGEIYDARRRAPGAVGGEPVFEQHAQKTDYPVIPMASDLELIREHETFPAKLIYSPEGEPILDFGQNLAGYIRFKIHGEEGQTVILRMFEVPDNGRYSDTTVAGGKNCDTSIDQKIEYICDGETDVFEPEFFYSGFRYALVEGLDEVNPADFEAVAVYTDIKYGGTFTCSNEKINQFVKNTIWSEKSNFVDVPTDCPQREKSAWTGDAQVFVKAATYFADTAAFYRKWLKDVRDCQREDGRVDNVCPKIRGMEPRDVLNGSSGWADVAVIIPYTMWKMYGDSRFITENYEMLHGWKEYVIASANDKSIYSDENPMKKMVEPYLLPESPYQKYVIESGLHWGEWAEPEDEMAADPGIYLIKPKQEVTTAYLHYSMTLLEEMLREIGKEEEADQCREYAQGAKAAYQYYFVKDDTIEAKKMAPLVRPLALGLLEETTQKNVAARLNEMAIARDYTVGTGFLSTPFLLSVLVKHGYAETAYKILENTKEPGWLAMVEQGATTVWERYHGFDEQGHPLEMSMNHYSPGAVCAFLFDTVCGITVTAPQEFQIAPVPGGSLTYAQAEYPSVWGTVKSAWEKTENGYHFQVSIPANTTAIVALPDGQRYEVESGEYEWEVTI